MNKQTILLKIEQWFDNHTFTFKQAISKAYDAGKKAGLQKYREEKEMNDYYRKYHKEHM